MLYFSITSDYNTGEYLVTKVSTNVELLNEPILFVKDSDTLDLENIIINGEELDLKDCYIIDDYIFSHTGFNNHYWKLIQPGYKVGESISDVLFNYPELAARVSWRRGGSFNYGSHVWEDLHYFLESSLNKELSKYTQVFGHTFIKEAIHHNNCYCLDCQQIFKLDLNTHKLCYVSGKEIITI